MRTPKPAMVVPLLLLSFSLFSSLFFLRAGTSVCSNAFCLILRCGYTAAHTGTLLRLFSQRVVHHRNRPIADFSSDRFFNSKTRNVCQKLKSNRGFRAAVYWFCFAVARMGELFCNGFDAHSQINLLLFNLLPSQAPVLV